MKYNFPIIILLFFCLGISKTYAQNEIKRTELIKMLHTVDALIYDYESYCSLSNSYSISDKEIEQFINLFDNKAILIDDISTNRIDNDLEVNEKEKGISEYTADIKKQYEDVKVKILKSSLGEASKDMYQKDGIFFFPVHITKVTSAYAKDKKDYEIHADILILVGIKKEENQEYSARIYDIRKKNQESIDWLPQSVIKEKKKRWMLNYNIGYLSNSLEFTPVMQSGAILENYSSKGGTGYFGGLELRNYLAGRAPYGLSLSLGVNMTQFTTDVELGKYANVFVAKDLESESYYHIVDAKAVKSTWDLQYLDVPLKLNLDLKLSKGLSFFINGGVNISYLLSGTYTQSGIYSYRAYYPQYNITLSDKPSLGLGKDVNEKSEGDLNMKDMHLSWTAGLGFGFNFKSFSVLMGASMQQSLGSITEKPSSESSIINSKIASPDISYQMDEISSRNLSFQLTIRKNFGKKKSFKVNRVQSSAFQY